MKKDVLIIGSGVIGLSVAYSLSKIYGSIVVVEKESSFGRGISGRGSGVIHAGIYYEPNSLMAKLCVEGKEKLYSLCAEVGIRHRKVGKIIVANATTGLDRLEELFIRAKTNSVTDLEFLSGKEVSKLEPMVSSVGGIFSPSTGIVDTNGLMNFLYTTASNNNVEFLFNTKIEGLEWSSHGIKVSALTKDGENITYTPKVVINCAGLSSDYIASLTGIDIDKEEYRVYYCKGDYFVFKPSFNNKFNHLIYPTKEPRAPGLGVHVTIDLDGRIRLGPDAFYIDKSVEGYTVDPLKLDSFIDSVRKYIPSITANDIEPEKACIRPKITPPGEHQKDFVIRHESDLKLYGLINLIGIESPGLTSSLAIARYVKDIIKDDQILS